MKTINSIFYEEVKQDIHILEQKPTETLIYAVLAKYSGYTENEFFLENMFIEQGRCKFICINALLEELKRMNNMLILKVDSKTQGLPNDIPENIHDVLAFLLSLYDKKVEVGEGVVN